MKKVILAATVLSSVVISGCAKNTSELQTAYVSPLVYADYSCKQLSGEMGRITRRVGDLGHSINENAEGDSVAMGVGLVLFWPALFFIDGDSPEAQEYSRLKGEYEAVEKTAIKNECDIELAENPFTKIEEEKQKREEEQNKNWNRRKRG